MKLSILYGLFASAMAVYALPTTSAPSTTPTSPARTDSTSGGATSSGGSDDNNGATPFYITAPLSGVTYARGDDATVQWSNGIPETFKIVVLTGENSASMQPAGYEFSADGITGVYKWTVPSDLSDGKYAFEFKFKDKKGAEQEAYSNQFRITGSPRGGRSVPALVGPSSSFSSTSGKTASDSSSRNEAMPMRSGSVPSSNEATSMRSAASDPLPPSKAAVVGSSRGQ